MASDPANPNNRDTHVPPETQYGAQNPTGNPPQDEIIGQPSDQEMEFSDSTLQHRSDSGEPLDIPTISREPLTSSSITPRTLSWRAPSSGRNLFYSLVVTGLVTTFAGALVSYFYSASKMPSSNITTITTRTLEGKVHDIIQQKNGQTSYLLKEGSFGKNLATKEQEDIKQVDKTYELFLKEATDSYETEVSEINTRYKAIKTTAEHEARNVFGWNTEPATLPNCKPSYEAESEKVGHRLQNNYERLEEILREVTEKMRRKN